MIEKKKVCPRILKNLITGEEFQDTLHIAAQEKLKVYKNITDI
jgi:hypothetical protein